MSVSSSSPEDRAVAGIKAAVQGAKSFYQNGEEAASFFGNWIGPACGVPDFDFDIFAVFGSLVGAPDSMSLGAPVGCKKKTGCRDVDPVPDPPNKPDIPTNKPTDEPPAPAITDEPKITAEPTATGNPTTTTVTTTSTAGAACAYCGGFNKKQVARDGKYQAMYARAGNSNNGPVCVMPPRKDILSKRDVSDLIRNRLSSRSFLLQERALTEKNSKIRTELGKEGQINPYMWECSVGKYAPSSDAANIAEIIKYWTFKKPQDQKKCSVEVEKVATGTISDFESKEPPMVARQNYSRPDQNRLTKQRTQPTTSSKLKPLQIS